MQVRCISTVHDIDNDSNDEAIVGKKKGRCFPCHGASRVVRVHIQNIQILTAKLLVFISFTHSPLLSIPYVASYMYVIRTLVVCRWKLHQHRCLLCIISRSNKTTSACTFSLQCYYYFIFDYISTVPLPTIRSIVCVYIYS